MARSGLYQEQQCRELHVRFSQEGGAGPAVDTKPLAKWLIEKKYLTLYQAQVLLAGRPGPFIYGDYKLLERISEGGLQGCFRAIHSATRCPVLMQFLAGEAVNQPETWKALSRWLGAVCAIRDPHVQRWFQVVDLGNIKFLVAEALSGETLDDVVRRGYLKSARACWLIQQAARGVQVVHQQGWCHGQLRPSTIWVTPSQSVKLLLHGLASPTTLVPPDPLVAADYAAPELSLSGVEPSPSCDVYALGCLLYQLLSGRPPFPDGTIDEKVARHAKEPIPSLARRKVRPDLEQLIARMMAKNPAVRLATMAEVIDGLEPFVEDEPHLMPPAMPDRIREAYEAALAQAAATQASVGEPPARKTPSSSPAAALRGIGNKARPAPAAAPAPTVVPASAPSRPTPAPSRPAPTPAHTTPTPARPTSAPARPTSAQAGAGPLADLEKIAAADRTVRRAKPAAQPSRWSRSKGVWMGGGVALAVCLIVIGWGAMYFGGGTGRGTDRDQPPSPIAEGDSGERVRANAESDSTTETADRTIPDDGESLWASPTRGGSPIDLRGVPPDSLLTIVLRPAAIASQDEGPRVLRALGPEWDTLQRTFVERLGVPWEELDQLVISLHDQGAAPVRPALSARLATPRSLSELQRQWGSPSVKDEAKGIYEGENSSAYFCWGLDEREGNSGEDVSENSSEGSSEGSGARRVRGFVWGPSEEVTLVADRRGAPPVAPPGTEPLLRHSDNQRMLNILFIPQYWHSNLLRDGREFYHGEPAELRLFLEWLLGEGIRAGLASVHLGSESSYLELQLVTTELGARPLLASRIRERLEELPELVETYLATEVQPPEYWRRVAFRFPLMLRFLLDQTRVQVENERILLNALLPPEAPHNLAFASEMLLASPQGAPVASRTETSETGPSTLEEVMRERMSLRFDQLALEAALAAIVSDIRESYPRLPFEFDVKIVGEDFEKGGITRNQQVVNFDQRDATVEEVLTALVQRANPITTVRSPSEPDQKLIWVLAPDPDRPSRTIVLLTTREGAEARDWPLPAVFQ